MAGQEIIVGRQLAITGNPDIRDLVLDWHAHLALIVGSHELAELSGQSYRRGVDKFLGWCDDNVFAPVEGDTLRAWKKDLLDAGLKPNSVNAWLAGVRSFFAWATGKRRLAFNPSEGVKTVGRKGTTQRHLRDRLTNTEMVRVLARPDDTTTGGKRDAAILCLMAYTGARTIEVHRANIGDLRTDGDSLVLHVHGKGRDEADEVLVLSHPDVQAAIHTWQAARGNRPGPLFTSLSRRSFGGRLSLVAIRHMVKRYYRGAGVVGDTKTTHSMRHSAITNAGQRGAAPMALQTMARHKSFDTTLAYYHEIDRLAHPAEALIDYSDAGK